MSQNQNSHIWPNTTHGNNAAEHVKTFSPSKGGETCNPCQARENMQLLYPRVEGGKTCTLCQGGKTYSPCQGRENHAGGKACSLCQGRESIQPLWRAGEHTALVKGGKISLCQGPVSRACVNDGKAYSSCQGRENIQPVSRAIKSCNPCQGR